jgi:hypothetical protein
MKTDEFVTEQGALGQLVELVPGRWYALFLAGQPEELPAPAVLRELRVLARAQAVADRGVVDEVLLDAGSGIVGGAAWGAVTASATATLAYLRARSRRPAPARDAEQAIARVREAASRILGPQPGELTGITAVRAADGGWQVDFGYGGTWVRTLLDPSGCMLQWEQTAAGGAGSTGATGAGSAAGVG